MGRRAPRRSATADMPQPVIALVTGGKWSYSGGVHPSARTLPIPEAMCGRRRAGTGLCGAGVAVVQPADLRDGDDAPAAGRLDLTRVRGIAAKRSVATRSMIGGEIGPQEALEMGFVEHDDVVQALAPDRAD